MRPLNVIVLAHPAARSLAMLEELPDETHIAVGNRAEGFIGVAEEADIMVTRMAPVELVREVWQMAPNLRWVHSLSAGVNNSLFPEFIQSPVPLTNARGVYSRSLSEFAIGAALFFAKDIKRMLRQQAAETWEEFDVEEIYGKTMGIVGYGSIGRAVAERARDFGMRVIAVRRKPDPSNEDVFPPERLNELMAASDYITAAAPLTPSTHHLIGAEALAAMKPTGVIINIGRGPVIDEAALIDILQKKQIRGAALDVFESEPLPKGHPFYSFDNVLLSPHSADHTPGWEEASLRLFLDNFERFRNGEQLLNIVDKEAGY